MLVDRIKRRGEEKRGKERREGIFLFIVLIGSKFNAPITWQVV